MDIILNKFKKNQSIIQVDTPNRNLIRHDMGTIIYGLQAGQYANFVDLSCYAFVYDEYNQVRMKVRC